MTAWFVIVGMFAPIRPSGTFPRTRGKGTRPTPALQ